MNYSNKERDKMKKDLREKMREEWAKKAQYEYPFGITMANLAIINYIDYLEDELTKCYGKEKNL